MSTLPPPIGIIGGMGPSAGILLAGRVAAFTRANGDADHLPVALLSYPDRIPDRSAYLAGREVVNPAGPILDVAEALGHLGVRVAGIACNTAHAPAIFDKILAGLPGRAPELRLLHLVRESARAVREMAPSARRVGVLATLGTYRTGIYDRALEEEGLIAVLPTPTDRSDLVHRAIYDPRWGIKARPDRVTDEALEAIDEAIGRLADDSCDAVVLGCTEFSLAFDRPRPAPVSIVDSTTALARALVRETAPERLLPLVNPGGGTD